MENEQNLMKQTQETGQKPHFGPDLGPRFARFRAGTFFFQKSDFVTFLDLLKANLMQKIRKN